MFSYLTIAERVSNESILAAQEQVKSNPAYATLAVSREVPITKELLPYFTETQGMTWILSKGMVKSFDSQHGSQYTIAFLAHFVVKIMTIS